MPVKVGSFTVFRLTFVPTPVTVCSVSVPWFRVSRWIVTSGLEAGSSGCLPSLAGSTCMVPPTAFSFFAGGVMSSGDTPASCGLSGVLGVEVTLGDHPWVSGSRISSFFAGVDSMVLITRSFSSCCQLTASLNSPSAWSWRPASLTLSASPRNCPSLSASQVPTNWRISSRSLALSSSSLWMLPHSLSSCWSFQASCWARPFSCLRRCFTSAWRASLSTSHSTFLSSGATGDGCLSSTAIPLSSDTELENRGFAGAGNCTGSSWRGPATHIGCRLPLASSPRRRKSVKPCSSRVLPLTACVPRRICTLGGWDPCRGRSAGGELPAPDRSSQVRTRSLTALPSETACRLREGGSPCRLLPAASSSFLIACNT